jgi:CubicO group peptidase (beta-lactamase class C family)
VKRFSMWRSTSLWRPALAGPIRLSVFVILSAAGLTLTGYGIAAQQTPLAPARSVSASTYFPPRGAWERRKPSEVGMDEAKLAAAIERVRTLETTMPKDWSTHVRSNGRLLGPLPQERGAPNGVIIRNGYLVAEYGDTSQVDPTFSVAKSYLSTILGLTVDRGLIKSVKDPVRDYVKDGGYDSPHNARITWEHHARQTSEWDGTLWEKPANFVGAEEFGTAARQPRALAEPGTHYEYNDVRINRFALSLLRVWRKPLPDVLKTEIMDPIGASDTWRYHGYNNSDVEIDGKTMKSVSGGTRWGGGLWMNSLDHARFGYLILRRGNWHGRQIISEAWIREATARGGTDVNDYGYLWWLNTQGRQWRGLPATSFAAIGNGPNIIWIDPEHDLVVVRRWYRNGDDTEFFRQILDSIEPGKYPPLPAPERGRGRGRGTAPGN